MLSRSHLDHTLTSSFDSACHNDTFGPLARPVQQKANQPHDLFYTLAAYMHAKLTFSFKFQFYASIQFCRPPAPCRTRTLTRSSRPVQAHVCASMGSRVQTMPYYQETHTSNAEAPLFWRHVVLSQQPPVLQPRQPFPPHLQTQQ